MGRCGVDSSESRHTGSSEILCNRDRNDRDRSWPAWHCARAANFAVDPRQGCNCAALKHWPPTLEIGRLPLVLLEPQHLKQSACLHDDSQATPVRSSLAG